MPLSLLTLKSLLLLLTATFPAFIFSLRLSQFLHPCDLKPSSNSLKTLIWDKTAAIALLTCNDKFYHLSPTLEEIGGGVVIIASIYTCSEGDLWTSRDLNLPYKIVECAIGCPNVINDDTFHLFSEEADCLQLITKNETDKRYGSCEASCKPGYFPVVDGTNKMATMRIFCKDKGDGTPYWNIPAINSDEENIECTIGCDYYGARRGEETYGATIRCDKIGIIDGLMKHSSCDLECDSYAGFYPSAGTETDTVTINLECYYGDHWSPRPLDFYCKKGCRAPGKNFYDSPEQRTGLKVRCTGSGFGDGWYTACGFTCDTDNGWIPVNKGLTSDSSDVVECVDGKFVYESVMLVCKKSFFVVFIGFVVIYCFEDLY